MITGTAAASLALAIVAFTSACGGPGLTSNPEREARLSGNVKATLTAPDSVRTGSVLHVRVSLMNTSADSVQISLAGQPERPYIGVVITRFPAGDTVVTLFNSQTMLRVLHTRMLGPSESVELPAEIVLPGATDRSLPPGQYRIRARVLADPADWITEARQLTVTF